MQVEVQSKYHSKGILVKKQANKLMYKERDWTYRSLRLATSEWVNHLEQTFLTSEIIR